MRASAALLLLTLAALTFDARAATCSYVCDASQTPATTCHATCDVTFTICAMGQTCAYSFDLAGSDAQTGARFEVGTDAGSVRGGTVGGDPSCTAAGCDRQKLSLTFQSASLNATWDAGAGCEVTDTPRRCPFDASRAPKSPPLTRVTAKVTCENTLLPCANAKVSATVDFYAKVAWPSPPPPPPASSPPPNPPAPPPTPPAPPPAPGAFAPGGSGRRALGAVLLVLWVFLVAYAVLGYAFTRIYARDEAPASWQWARRWAPFRCDEELAAGGGRGIRGECELLWCWCVPAYWRSSEREAMDAYWAYHPADEP